MALWPQSARVQDRGRQHGVEWDRDPDKGLPGKEDRGRPPYLLPWIQLSLCFSARVARKVPRVVTIIALHLD